MTRPAYDLRRPENRPELERRLIARVEHWKRTHPASAGALFLILRASSDCTRLEVEWHFGCLGDEEPDFCEARARARFDHLVAKRKTGRLFLWSVSALEDEDGRRHLVRCVP